MDANSLHTILIGGHTEAGWSFFDFVSSGAGCYPDGLPKQGSSEHI